MLGYTLAQFGEFSRAVVRTEKRKAHEFLTLSRAAQQDQKIFKKVEKALRDG